MFLSKCVSGMLLLFTSSSCKDPGEGKKTPFFQTEKLGDSMGWKMPRNQLRFHGVEHALFSTLTSKSDSVAPRDRCETNIGFTVFFLVAETLIKTIRDKPAIQLFFVESCVVTSSE